LSSFPGKALLTDLNPPTSFPPPLEKQVAIKKMKKKFYTWEECMQLREVKVGRCSFTSAF
jgi:hypothetical protein